MHADGAGDLAVVRYVAKRGHELVDVTNTSVPRFFAEAHLEVKLVDRLQFRKFEKQRPTIGSTVAEAMSNASWPGRP